MSMLCIIISERNKSNRRSAVRTALAIATTYAAHKASISPIHSRGITSGL